MATISNNFVLYLRFGTIGISWGAQRIKIASRGKLHEGKVPVVLFYQKNYVFH